MPFLAFIPPLLATIGMEGAATALAGTLTSVGISAGAMGATGAVAGAMGPSFVAGLTGAQVLSAGTGLLSMAGTGLSALSSYEQGKTQEEMYKYDAAVMDQKARAEQIKGKAEAEKLSDQRRKMVGSQLAGYAGGGVDPQVGSPLEVMANTYGEYERDIQMTGYNTDTAVRQAASQADIYRYAAGRAGTAGLIGAGTQLLGGVGKSLLRMN